MKIIAIILVIGISCFAGCTKSNHTPHKIILQTDWFAQPEHGGFYQALAKGYYNDEGLEVTILQGGPNAMTTQKVLKGSAHFAMHRADAVFTMTQRDVPVIFVMPTLQHDPQGLLLHQSNPIDSLEDLDNQKVMAIPGLSWIKWVEARYDIEMEIIPHDFGMERFLRDPNFIQQCLITNEPYYAELNGAQVKTLRLAESGFDPYHGIYCLKSYAEEHPVIVQKFINASLKGWYDFITNDPTPAFELISAKNPKMNKAFMQFSYNAMKTNNLVIGESPNTFGTIDPKRMDGLVDQMKTYKLVEESASANWYTTKFLKP